MLTPGCGQIYKPVDNPTFLKIISLRSFNNSTLYKLLGKKKRISNKISCTNSHQVGLMARLFLYS